jgi:hypothetical protein
MKRSKKHLSTIDIIDLRLEIIESELESQKVLVDELLFQLARENYRKKLENELSKIWLLTERK